LKTRISFPSGTKLLLKTLLKKLIKNEVHGFVSSAINSIPGLDVARGAASFFGVGSSLSALEDVIIDYVEDAAIGDDVKLRTLAADICFTMRDNSIAAGVPSFGSDTCDVMIRPDLENGKRFHDFHDPGGFDYRRLVQSRRRSWQSGLRLTGQLRDTAKLIWRSLGQYLLDAIARNSPARSCQRSKCVIQVISPNRRRPAPAKARARHCPIPACWRASSTSSC
jgi:hypothetical protein